MQSGSSEELSSLRGGSPLVSPCPFWTKPITHVGLSHIVQPERGEPSRFSVSILDQADNPRRLVAHDDDADVSSCAYPYATVLDGIRWWVQRDRLSFPLHGVEDQSRPWGPCITPASGGEELHLYGTQVIKDLIGPCPSSLAHAPFRGNGSQLCHVRGFPAFRLLCPI